MSASGGSELPRLSRPTPLLPAPRLGRLLGIDDLHLKRDDLIGFAWGGNKVRTVDALLHEAVRTGTRRLVVCGGAGSNLGAILAVAGAVADIEIHRIVNGSPGTVEPAALEACRLAGAVIHHTGDDARESMEPVGRRLAASLGPDAVMIPRGGATAVGAAAFADAADELVAQSEGLPSQLRRVIVPVGSGGTVAGLAAGLGRHAGVALVGIAVSRDPEEQAGEIRVLAREIATRVGRTAPPARFDLIDGRGSGFGLVDEAERSFAERILRRTGLVVDRTYNLKALRACVDAVGAAPPVGGSTVYWFTGGALDAIDRTERPTMSEEHE